MLIFIFLERVFKLKRILVLSLTAFLVLAGCNSGDKTDTKDKKEETKQTSKANKENKEQHHKQENDNKASTQLSKRKVSISILCGWSRKIYVN